VTALSPEASVSRQNFGLHRLPFVLPDFTRWMWVSEQARAVWSPRCRQIVHAWQRTEWLAVQAGLRRCAVILVPAEQYATYEEQWAAGGLCSEVLERIPASGGGKRAGERGAVLECLVGSARDLVSFREALESEAGPTVAEYLGMPACCYRFNQEVAAGDLTDTTWPMACATPGRRELASGLEVGGPWENNLLFRWLGVRAVPHLPCSFTCAASTELGRQMLSLTTDAGLSCEVEWMREVLSWPAEWSALHGIAEIRTPIVKIVTRTDATATCYVVRRAGTSYPAEGAYGLDFPFQARSVHRATTALIAPDPLPLFPVLPLAGSQAR
jgi:hypothetical protein